MHEARQGGADRFKPWFSVSEQIHRLRERGMRVTDEAGARDHLERIGYYRLSG